MLGMSACWAVEPGPEPASERTSNKGEAICELLVTGATMANSRGPHQSSAAARAAGMRVEAPMASGQDIRVHTRDSLHILLVLHFADFSDRTYVPCTCKLVTRRTG